MLLSIQETTEQVVEGLEQVEKKEKTLKKENSLSSTLLNVW